jgi:DNA processing protein
MGAAAAAIQIFPAAKLLSAYFANATQPSMENNVLYQLALSRIDGIGPVHTKTLMERFGDARSIFHASRIALGRSGLNQKLIDGILQFSGYDDLRRELRHLQHKGVRTLFFNEPDYPRRLLHLPNMPTLLFYQGAADLNAAKIIAIAGTRSPSPYGTQVTAQLVSELAQPDLLIISGLAYGIDAIAHRTAVNCAIPTVGVLGHGHDHVYPAVHRGLFHLIRRKGGLLASFPHEKMPDTYTFPVRNQLVAGLCDALIVIESGNTGGSLSAAAAALKFRKKVFAVPGRITDQKSQGCLQLIHEQKAMPIISAEQLKAALGWDWSSGGSSHQRTLPFFTTERARPMQTESMPIPIAQTREQAEPSPPISKSDPSKPGLESQCTDPLENQLIDLLAEHQPLSFEDLLNLSHQPVPTISVALINLEIRGVIRSLPGRRYRLTP